ncbi:hypothetical protein AMECASPLE_021275 [Ameca splendens]|uniref:Uncharacterized protein n=1 Tax=Ameca splendens TaxID=208324 RepID=A0ABV0ZCC8_9TELE
MWPFSVKALNMIQGAPSYFVKNNHMFHASSKQHHNRHKKLKSQTPLQTNNVFHTDTLGLDLHHDLKPNGDFKLVTGMSAQACLFALALRRTAELMVYRSVFLLKKEKNLTCYLK